MKRFTTNSFRRHSSNVHCSDVSLDHRLTVGSPSGFNANSLLKLVSVLVLVLTIGVGNAWGDETITEDFENTKQEIQMNNNNAYYQGSVTYDAEDSNAEIGWSVEHGTVSTDAALNGSRSLQMRAYYSKNSATSAWNGNLPYLQSTTAVTGLKSISFNAKVSSTTNQNLLVDISYSTNGSSWSAMKTNAQTPADATSIAYTTTSTEYTYNIPSSDPTTDYYIKIAVSSSSTHTTNAQKASGSGNIKLIIDNIVFTYTSASCTATPSIGDASLNGSFFWTTHFYPVWPEKHRLKGYYTNLGITSVLYRIPHHLIYTMYISRDFGLVLFRFPCF